MKVATVAAFSVISFWDIESFTKILQGRGIERVFCQTIMLFNMSEFAKILIPALLALIVSFLTYHYQFRRNNRFIFLNRVRHLLHRIDEAHRIIIAEKEHVETLVSKIEGNSLQMYLLGTTGYPAVKFLKEKVTHEDYFIAFSYIFKDAIEGKRQFEKLQYSSVLLDTQLDMIKEMAVNALKGDYARRINYIDLWHKSEAIMVTFSQRQAMRKDDEVQKAEVDYFNALTAAASPYFTKLQSGEIKPEISSIQEFFINPVRAFFKNPIVFPELVQYSALLDDINYVYDDIVFQNMAILKNLKEDVLKMDNVISKLDDVRAYLQNEQIRSLYV